MKKFDVILSNPPFQDIANRKKTPHKLWIDFTVAELTKWLKDEGYLFQVSPSSFLSPSNKILPLFKSNATSYINIDVSHYFPGVGSSFAAYVVQKKNMAKAETTFVIAGGNTFKVALDEKVLYLPVDLCEESFSIHQKVIHNYENKLPIRFDYVTHHNIRLKDKVSTLSKVETETHKYPVFHTNRQIWWSSVRQDDANLPKVMWTRSGYTLPFFDDGTYGTTDMGYYTVVNSKTEGENLAHNLNLKLMLYIFSTAKWSGFGNEIVFRNLPSLPVDRKLTDKELYDFFNLTTEEVAYVESYKEKKVIPNTPKSQLLQQELDWEEIERKADTHSYMGKITRAAERVKLSAEIFTPTKLVIELLSQVDIEAFGPGRIVLDPACGDGQFLVVAKLIKTLFHKMTEEDALSEIYGVDLMKDNVLLAKERLGGGNIVVGNTMKPTVKLAEQTDEEFSLMKELFS